MTIQTNRSLGGWGAALTVTGVISTIITTIEYVIFGFDQSTNLIGARLALAAVSGVVSLLALIGFILFLVAMYGVSRDYSEHKIFSYIIYGLIGSIITAVVIGVIWIAYFLSNLSSLIPTLNQTVPPSEIQSLFTPSFSLLATLGSVVGLIWILFNVKAINLLSDKSGVPLFRTAARLFLLGAILNIVIGAVVAVLTFSSAVSFNALFLALAPGSIIQYVAWAILAKAFFTIKVPPTPAYTASPNPPAPTPIYPSQTHYCMHCGATITPDSTYCTRCGQKL